MTTVLDEQHDSAVRRLHAKLVEQHRLDERFHDAIGTATELGAYVRLRTAGGQVAALDAWLHWIDDEAYRGLNAGPFELLAESSGPAAVQIRPQGTLSTSSGPLLGQGG